MHCPSILCVWLVMLAECESRNNPQAVNDRGEEKHANGQRGSFGLFQFGKPTWDGQVKQAVRLGWGDIGWIHLWPDEADRQVQWDLAALLWDGGEGAYHWLLCSRDIGYCDLEPSHCVRP